MKGGSRLLRYTTTWKRGKEAHEKSFRRPASASASASPLPPPSLFLAEEVGRKELPAPPTSISPSLLSPEFNLACGRRGKGGERGGGKGCNKRRREKEKRENPPSLSLFCALCYPAKWDFSPTLFFSILRPGNGATKLRRNCSERKRKKSWGKERVKETFSRKQK